MKRQDFKNILLHAFFPSRCSSCDVVIQREHIFCEKCLSSIEYNKNESYYISPFLYTGTVRNALINLKEDIDENMVDYFSKSICSKIKSQYKNIKFDCVVPIPMYEKKKKIRGYNQSEILAKRVADNLLVNYDDKVLTQPFDTKTQHILSYDERIENVKGKYFANANSYNNILLIDDIITTGATMNECAKMLKKSGAENVYFASVAMVE